MFMHMCWRRWGKPECISAEIERARARSAASAGHSAGLRSARYSRMASESQTCRSPSTRQGTLPAGEYRSSSRLDSGRYSGMRSSRNSMPSAFIASHARSDQDE